MVTESKSQNRIAALDGIRAISICLVVWFHFWQQSWLTPPWPIEPFVRYGAVFVDMLILLSAFLNFMPFAKAIREGTAMPGAREFYRKRLIRIVPSYVLCVLVLFLMAVMEGAYEGGDFGHRDLFHALTFTSFANKSVYLGSRITGVLWTVQIEMWYYLLMPLFARAFRKMPIITCTALIGSSQAIITYITTYQTDKIRMYSNHFLSFAGYYAYGMILCMLYLWHQAISVKLKMYRFPYWEGDVPPNQLGDRVWMWKYQILIIFVSLLVALMTTCFVEKNIMVWYNKKVKIGIRK